MLGKDSSMLISNKFSKTLLGMLIFSSILFNLSPVSACPAGNLWSNNKYVRRQGNRCEGIKENTGVGTGLELLSFSIKNEVDYSAKNKILLRVPRSEKIAPEIRIESLSHAYLLDKIKFTPTKDYYEFYLPTKILGRVGIGIEDLTSVAYFESSQRTLAPVIFDDAKKNYEIVLFSPGYFRILKFEIRTQGRSVYERNSRVRRAPGKISLIWDGRMDLGGIAPQGSYQLFVEAEIQKIDGTKERQVLSKDIYHSPSWMH